MILRCASRGCLAALCCTLIVLLGFAAPSAANRLKPDVRLLIDISGSMRDSDPANLRAPALELIVRLLPEGSRAGVWVFGETARELVPHGVVNAEWRALASATTSVIDNSGLRTNIPEALAAATRDIASLDPRFRSSIILLTDGKVDVSESPVANARAVRELLETVAPSLAATGIPVHTIALSDAADLAFLASLSDITAGVAERAQSADDLAAIYLQALDMVAPEPRVPLVAGQFSIDESVREFTALAYFGGREAEAVLVSPEGRRYTADMDDTGVRWYQTSQYSIATVATPSAGEWRLETSSEATLRVTVVADLELEVDPPPNSMPAGRAGELGIRLLERGAVITDPELLSVFDITVEVTSDKGYRQDIAVSARYQPPETGEYRVSLPALEVPGRYQLQVRVSGKTFQRELPLVLDIIPTQISSRISTRSEALPGTEGLMERIALFSGPASALLVIMVWYLWRRRRQRHEQWLRRRRAKAEPDLVPGFSADDEVDLRRD